MRRKKANSSESKKKKQQDVSEKGLTDFGSVPNDSQRFPMVLNGTQRYSTVLNGTQRLRMVANGTARSRPSGKDRQKTGTRDQGIGNREQQRQRRSPDVNGKSRLSDVEIRNAVRPKGLGVLDPVAKLCESLRNVANRCESLRIVANRCESLRIVANRCESLRNVANLPARATAPGQAGKSLRTCPPPAGLPSGGRQAGGSLRSGLRNTGWHASAAEAWHQRASLLRRSSRFGCEGWTGNSLCVPTCPPPARLPSGGRQAGRSLRSCPPPAACFVRAVRGWVCLGSFSLLLDYSIVQLLHSALRPAGTRARPAGEETLPGCKLNPAVANRDKEVGGYNGA